MVATPAAGYSLAEEAILAEYWQTAFQTAPLTLCCGLPALHAKMTLAADTKLQQLLASRQLGPTHPFAM
jgi:hypothetical protein